MHRQSVKLAARTVLIGLRRLEEVIGDVPRVHEFFKPR